MLTDSELKHLKGKEKPYEVSERDGMYVYISTAGTVSFRYDDRINGRRETLVKVFRLCWKRYVLMLPSGDKCSGNPIVKVVQFITSGI